MSRIGRKPIAIPAGVEVKLADGVATVKGPKGTLTQAIHPNMKVEVADGQILVTRPDDEKENRALHGLTRALLNNMVEGVTNGFSKQLDVNGVGYRVQKQGKDPWATAIWSPSVRFRASPLMCRVPTPSLSAAPTSSWWASLPPRCARSARRSRLRARASNTPTRLSAARKARPAARARSKESEHPW